MPENKHIEEFLENYLEGTVFPSDEKTIMPIQTDGEYRGAHNYLVRKCTGFHDGRTHYANSANLEDFVQIDFVRKYADGAIAPGLQNEQLVILLKDRIQKLNKKFPHPENENMIKALDDFLDATRRRVEERMDRGVMGDLKK